MVPAAQFDDKTTHQPTHKLRQKPAIRRWRLPQRHDDQRFSPNQRIERAQQKLLPCGLANKPMDVIDKQDVAALELAPKIANRLSVHRMSKLPCQVRAADEYRFGTLQIDFGGVRQRRATVVYLCPRHRTAQWDCTAIPLKRLSPAANRRVFHARDERLRRLR